MAMYIFILVLLLFGVFHFDYKENRFFKKFYYFVVFVVCTLMMCLRYRVGGDSLTYEDIYNYLPNLRTLSHYMNSRNKEDFQYGYLLFVAICRNISKDYYFYQFVHGVIFNLVFFWFVYKHSNKPFTAVLLTYFFIIYFYFGYEIQREIFAICCFLLSYSAFLKNKWIIYYFFCLLAFSFHNSAVFLFVLPLLKLVKLSTKFIYISLIFSIPIIISKIAFMDLIKVLLVTEAMQKKGEAYSEIEFSALGTIFFYFARVIIFVPFLLYYAKNKIEDKKYDWLFVGIFWVAMLSQAMIGIDRFNNYLYIPFIVFLSNFLYDERYRFRSWLHRKTVNLSGYLLLFSVICLKFFTHNIEGKYYFYNVFFPYETVLDKKDTKEREDYLEEMWKTGN